MHLCGIVKENGHYHKPQFVTIEAARPAALFSYIVHIIRDFEKDQKNNLNYFAEDLMIENGLNKLELNKIAENGEISPGFRSLMGRYYALADYYRGRTKEMLNKIRSFIEPRYLLSIELIYSLYLQIFERVDIEKGSFTTQELNPSPEEVRCRIEQTISSFRS
jgi:phytoene/squalene synthetase